MEAWAIYEDMLAFGIRLQRDISRWSRYHVGILSDRLPFCQVNRRAHISLWAQPLDHRTLTSELRGFSGWRWLDECNRVRPRWVYCDFNARSSRHCFLVVFKLSETPPPFYVQSHQHTFVITNLKWRLCHHLFVRMLLIYGSVYSVSGNSFSWYGCSLYLAEDGRSVLGHCPEMNGVNSSTN